MRGRAEIPLKKICSLVCWVILIPSRQSVVGATTFAVNYPTKCIGTGQVTKPTSVYPTSEDFMGFPAQSRGVCTINGAGTELYDNFRFYGGYFMPPAEDIEDISLFKTTYASEPYSADLGKERAVSGIYKDDDMYASKDGLVQSWWIVDLSEVRTIHQAQIYTRQGCCPERLHDIEIRIGQELVLNGNLTSYTLMSTYKGPYDVSQGHLICSSMRGIAGRFLSIQKISSDTDNLQLVEVRIFAAKKNLYQN